MVNIKWEKNLFTANGTISYPTDKNPKVVIKLSKERLLTRSMKDIKEVLLHLMIHAHLYVKYGDKSNVHTQAFLTKMEEINNHPDTRKDDLSVSVNPLVGLDDPDIKRCYVWQCNRCGELHWKQSNNPPGSNGEKWFKTHQTLCSGTWDLINTPAGRPLIGVAVSSSAGRASGAAAAAGGGDGGGGGVSGRGRGRRASGRGRGGRASGPVGGAFPAFGGAGIPLGGGGGVAIKREQDDQHPEAVANTPPAKRAKSEPGCCPRCNKPVPAHEMKRHLQLCIRGLA
mmetsp:Transcript_38563/g.110288  ORF Transcript_38563/g.110288 Transcript_38563/m.110288 type:complete len:284 (+) Transcript_38563:349-1200(+)